MPIPLEASPADHKRSHRISREFGPAVAFSTVGGKGRGWFSAPKSIKYLVVTARLSSHSRRELSLWHSSHSSRDRIFSIWINEETHVNSHQLVNNNKKFSWSNNLIKGKKERYKYIKNFRLYWQTRDVCKTFSFSRVTILRSYRF